MKILCPFFINAHNVLVRNINDLFLYVDLKINANHQGDPREFFGDMIRNHIPEFEPFFSFGQRKKGT